MTSQLYKLYLQALQVSKAFIYSLLYSSWYLRAWWAGVSFYIWESNLEGKEFVKNIRLRRKIKLNDVYNPSLASLSSNNLNPAPLSLFIRVITRNYAWFSIFPWVQPIYLEIAQAWRILLHVLYTLPLYISFHPMPSHHTHTESRDQIRDLVRYRFNCHSAWIL